MWERVRKSTIRGISLKNEALKANQNPEALVSSKIHLLTHVIRKKTTMGKLNQPLHQSMKMVTQTSENIMPGEETKMGASLIQNTCRGNRRIIRIKTEHQTGNKNKGKISPGLKTSGTFENNREKSGWKKKSSPKFTPFEQKQLKKMTLYFAGQRRIQGNQEFTNDEGFPILIEGDSVCFRFQIFGEIARGSFGVVYKAYDHKRKQLVGLKVLRKDQKYTDQSLVEIKLLEKCLNSDYNANIVDIKYSCVFRGHSCIAFELLHQDLYEYSKENNFVGFGMQKTKKYIVQTLLAMRCFEQNKIIHCDLKPENMMLKYEDKDWIKIIDLGSGCIDGEQVFNCVQSRFYRAPEIILGMDYTSAIDMWSLGCIVVEFLTGRPLFAGKNEQQQMTIICSYLGVPDENFLKRGKRSVKYFDGKSLRCESIRGKRRCPGSKSIKSILQKYDDPQLIDFVEKILVWLPEDRMTVEQALSHPFIAQSIPQWRIEQYSIKLSR